MPEAANERANWINLNGLWDYAITGKGAVQPKTWEGQVLVPETT